MFKTERTVRGSLREWIEPSKLQVALISNLFFTYVFKSACNSGFKQRGAADFPSPGDSSLAVIVNAARQFHVERASADATTYPSLNY
jgi:hypothetical protein